MARGPVCYAMHACSVVLVSCSSFLLKIDRVFLSFSFFSFLELGCFRQPYRLHSNVSNVSDASCVVYPFVRGESLWAVRPLYNHAAMLAILVSSPQPRGWLPAFGRVVFRGSFGVNIITKINDTSFAASRIVEDQQKERERTAMTAEVFDQMVGLSGTCFVSIKALYIILHTACCI